MRVTAGAPLVESEAIFGIYPGLATREDAQETQDVNSKGSWSSCTDGLGCLISVLRSRKRGWLLYITTNPQ